MKILCFRFIVIVFWDYYWTSRVPSGDERLVDAGQGLQIESQMLFALQRSWDCRLAEEKATAIAGMGDKTVVEIR